MLTRPMLREVFSRSARLNAPPISGASSHAFSRTCSLASACAPALHPQSDAARAGFCDAVAASSFRNQLFVRDALTAGVFDQAVQTVQCVALHIAIVQAESKFINVARQVLFAHLMVSAVHAALQHG